MLSSWTALLEKAAINMRYRVNGQSKIKKKLFDLSLVNPDLELVRFKQSGLGFNDEFNEFE